MLKKKQSRANCGFSLNNYEVTKLYKMTSTHALVGGLCFSSVFLFNSLPQQKSVNLAPALATQRKETGPIYYIKELLRLYKEEAELLKKQINAVTNLRNMYTKKRNMQQYQTFELTYMKQLNKINDLQAQINVLSGGW